MSIKDNLSAIRTTLPAHVTLVAVSKFHPAERIEQAYAAGQRTFGESRVQELTTKQSVLPTDIEWHMIGHLQTNKVRAIAPFVALIQSVDSARLTECIDREAARCGRVIDCLMEIHVAQEESKSGWAFDELVRYLHSEAFAALHNIRIRGVMGMATNTDDKQIVREDFEHLARCFRELAPLFDEHFDTLSMGMSDDYPLAVECGSTMVRVGSSIFGTREY
ncbi:MAG: YggS family pyridoxal phosphate-dependent enzyme [Alistipes sp.]|nr:YggS family pyridoxal phosphate-dependent enzyme [Alistipes sp.]